MQTTPKPRPPLDFAKVEALRKHMLLTTSDMASILGVSRMSYYGWVQGKALRKTNEEHVRAMLRRLLAIMANGWPMPEIIAASQKQRKARLVELLGNGS